MPPGRSVAAAVEHGLVPGHLGRAGLQALEALARRAERRLVVPVLPVRARLPRADDDTRALVLDGLEELAADPAGAILDRVHTVGHRGVPLLLGAVLQRQARDDGQHGRDRTPAHPPRARRVTTVRLGPGTSSASAP